MFESLVESIKSFSFQSVLKGNILATPGSFGMNTANGLTGGAKSNSPASNMVSNRYLSNYYDKMREIGDYEINDLTTTIIGIYKDFLIGFFNKDCELITIDKSVTNFTDIQARINGIFNEIKLIEEVKNHLWDIIYNGTYCFRLEFDNSTRSYKKAYLPNPHNVITVYKDNEILCYLAVSDKGRIYQMKPDSIFRLGVTDLSLINDVNPEFFRKEQKEDSLVKHEFLMASTPLYFNITGKVKEYLLKEQILSLLSIKDLIQPLLLLINLDKNTSIDEGNRLALNVENMINKYSDISSILGANFSINSLIDSLMNNIRVLPDYNGGIGNVNNVDLSKVTDKIDKIEQSQESKKDVIMAANCIPRALYSGESTKWDAIKSSQRLNSRVNSYVVSILDSIKLQAIRLAKEIYNVDIPKDLITVNLFKKTDVDYVQALTNTEMTSTLIQGLQGILTVCQQTLMEVKIIDPTKFATYVKEKLKDIDPDALQFISDSTIMEGIKAIQQAAQMQQ